MNNNFRYCGTITFNSNYTLEKKIKKIQSLKNLLENNLPFRGNRKYLLQYSIEYHKVKIGGEEIDDPEAPHVHLIILTNKILPKMWVGNVLEVLKRMGRSQFYLMTKLKFIQWNQYIRKDVLKNNGDDTLPFEEHWYEYELEQGKRELEESEDEGIEIDCREEI